MKTSRSSTNGRQTGPKKQKSSTTSSGAKSKAAPPQRVARTTTKNKGAEVAEKSLQEVLNRLNGGQNAYVADVETSGLDWKRHHIVGYALAFGPAPQDSYYVPFRHFGYANVGGRSGPVRADGWDGSLAPGEGDLIRALDRQSNTMFGHNLAFDLRMMHRVGFRMQTRFEDTAINEPMLDEFVGRYSLASCAHRWQVETKKSEMMTDYLMSKFNDIKSEKQAMGHFWRLPGDDPVANEYARGDGTTTWQLREKQWAEIQAQGMVKAHDIECRLIPVLVRMMVRGVRVDEERVGWISQEIKRRLEVLYNSFPSGFNERSPTDVRAWMEKHGRTDWPMTAPSKRFPGGQPSFKKEWLEKSDPGKQIVSLRKLSTLESSFVTPLRDVHMFNGRVFTQFNQLRSDEYGTVTARLSSSEPNMQQVPKHDEETGRLYRSAFVPDDGMIWGDDDYSQCEPRLLAYYTREPVLLDDYRNNPRADAHMAVTLAINGHKGWSSEELKKYRGNIGKRINQTLVTGGGKGVLVEKYGVDPNEVDQVWAEYFRRLPRIRPFQKKAARLYRQRGYMISLLGRRARLDDPNRDYTALNRLLQVGNADIIKTKMVEIDEYLQSEGGDDSGVHLLLNCHDALSTQFVEDSRPIYEECLRIAQDFSSEATPIKLDLPITMDHGEGPRWDIATYGEE